MYNPKLHFHFTGIGGSGMSGLAEILHNLGFKVTGSDQKIADTCEHLMQLGVQISLGHEATHVPATCSLLVFSSAVRPDNPEVVEAKKRGLPVIRRAEVLAELMRLKYSVGVAGSHGKTTTTSMTAAILERGGLDPTVILGGRVKSMSSGGKLGRSQYLVAETDESDRSFLLLKPTLAVVTNIDAEHLSAYASLADLEASFEQFVSCVPFYGLTVLCIDDPRVRELAKRYPGRKVTYGISPDAELRAVNFRYERGATLYDVYRHSELLFSARLPMPGKHLAINSLAAIAVGLEFEISPVIIAEALASFSGVSRRLEVCGVVNGVTVMTDYGHHPTEIKATLSAVRNAWGADINRLKVVFQPHRYSRTRDCFVDFLSCFSDAHELYLSEIYAASEDPIEGISGVELAHAVEHPHKLYKSELHDLALAAIENCKEGDVILCQGAGTVGKLPEQILSLLMKQQSTISQAA